MIARRMLFLSGLTASAVLVACTLNNNTALPPAPNNPAPVVGSNNVAENDLGDTQGSGHHWDIGSVNVQRIGPPGSAYTELVVSIAFEKNFPDDGTPDNAAFGSIPAPGTTATSGNQLAIVVDIDADSNAATGVTFTQCGPQGSYPGIDHAVVVGFHEAQDVPVLADGNAPVLQIISLLSFTQTGEAQITGGGNVVSLIIPLAALGGNSPGPSNIAVAVASGAPVVSSFNDCAPNLSEISASQTRNPLSIGVPPGSYWWGTVR